MNDLNIVFAGSPQFAAQILADLFDSPCSPIAVYTQPDRRQGRGRRLAPNPVKSLALEHHVAIEQPVSLRNNRAVERLEAYQPDLFVVAAYGLILPPAILAVPTYGCLNVHASLLPRWRGAAPIERAIMAGDTETGVCIMKMEEGLDTGPVYARSVTPINEPADPTALAKQLACSATPLLLDILTQYALCKADPTNPPPKHTQQSGCGITYAAKITAADRNPDWHMPAQLTARKVQALSARQPVRVTVDQTTLQLLTASAATMSSTDQPPGTILQFDKTGLYIQCATSVLQVSQLKVEKGKGTVLSASAAFNGYADLLAPGKLFHPLSSNPLGSTHQGA